MVRSVTAIAHYAGTNLSLLGFLLTTVTLIKKNISLRWQLIVSEVWSIIIMVEHGDLQADVLER